MVDSHENKKLYIISISSFDILCSKMYSYLAAIIAIIGYAFYKCYIYPLYLSPLRKIPGPPVENVILGHYASFLNKDQGEALVYLSRQYGGMVKYHGLLNAPNIVISDPQLVQQVLVTRSYEYPKLFLNKKFVKEFFGGEGILLAEGDSHKRQRKMMNPSFAFANVKVIFYDNQIM
ncbi:9155_t:CDS:1 [Cetraspora pellucida]|uniref:9155_t:CDS:1 n=1 Tax=Cetraspora pellucida TaxID=1433469 RepID=A0ACA9KS72_9GLOM|nr:9155_t:CDS:1 [Cetraspora pellucida]